MVYVNLETNLAAAGSLEALPDVLHQEATELYREYLLVGGMPACAEGAFLCGNQSGLEIDDSADF